MLFPLRVTVYILVIPAQAGIQLLNLDPRVGAPINRSLPEDDKL